MHGYIGRIQPDKKDMLLDKTIGYVHGYMMEYVKINRKDNRGYKRYAIGYESWICAWINQKDISGYKGYMTGYVYWIT